MTEKLRLKKPLPIGRSYEQVLNHYMVEKELAAKLLVSSRVERKALLVSMYDELFSKVPDHPRLSRRESKSATEKAINSKWVIVKKFLKPSTKIMEIAPGDCHFAAYMAERVKKVYAVDISTQHNVDKTWPKNLELIIFDGYVLEAVSDKEVDVAFSDQLLEHIHPDDTSLHLALILKKLVPGGVYVLRVPHVYSGPHDVSQYFSYTPKGFHLKEWTFRELRKLALEMKFQKVSCYFVVKGISIRFPYLYFSIMESILEVLPPNLRRFLAKYLVRSVCMGLWAPLR